MKTYKIILYVFLTSYLFTISCKNNKIITLESLLDEMVSVENMAKFPDPFYSCHQNSSYDRNTISPDSSGWFANNDGFRGGNFIRIDTINGRIEKVMMDESGPGAITRIWITSQDQEPILRFYFDGSSEAQFVIPAYDMTQIGIEGAGKGLVFPHTSYTKNGIGGSTSYFPIPFAKGCKITVEIPPDLENKPRYYQINFRKYEVNTSVESFSNEVAIRAEEKIREVNEKLLNPEITRFEITEIQKQDYLDTNDSLSVYLNEGNFAVHEITFEIDSPDKKEFSSIMRNLFLSGSFDGKQTIYVPLSDFSGGGVGAPFVENWYLSSDGKGKIVSRWLMPYRENAHINLTNFSPHKANVFITVKTAKYCWDENSLYFHTSWKEEKGLLLCNKPESSTCREWNMATLQGKGVFKGDVLSLYNHSKSWYGEGDEKIWVDDDNFPSHIGTGTEDYYNSSWAPVVVFQTPFGGAMRADSTNSRGYNTWLRTRNLDDIPFNKHFQFDFELLSWYPGTVDYASTVYWYGEIDAQAIRPEPDNN